MEADNALGDHRPALKFIRKIVARDVAWRHQTNAKIREDVDLETHEDGRGEHHRNGGDDTNPASNSPSCHDAMPQRRQKRQITRGKPMRLGAGDDEDEERSGRKKGERAEKKKP